jgi:hypothetical protein
MNITIRELRNYGILIVLAVIALLFRECQHQKQVDDLVVSIADYKDTAYYYKGENGKIVAYNEALELQNEEQVKALLKKDEDFKMLLDGFKSINATGGVTTIFEVKHDTIELHDTIPCDFEPIAVTKTDSTYDFFGTIMPSDFIIDSLKVPNEMKFVVGEKKVGLFKKETRIEVVNTNPLITTTGITAYTVQEPKKGFLITLSAIGGAIVGILVERLVVPH